MAFFCALENEWRRFGSVQKWITSQPELISHCSLSIICERSRSVPCSVFEIFDRVRKRKQCVGAFGSEIDTFDSQASSLEPYALELSNIVSSFSLRGQQSDNYLVQRNQQFASIDEKTRTFCDRLHGPRT